MAARLPAAPARRGAGRLRARGRQGAPPCAMLMDTISNASTRQGVGADDERCTMSLFLLEIEPAATTREGSQAVLDALRAATGDTAPAELIESQVAADHSRLFTILEADDAEGAGTVVAELREVLSALLAIADYDRPLHVGVLMGKREELVVSLLAIARLGAIYIPLFTAFATPARRR